MRFTVVSVVDVDLDAWELEYGVSGDEATQMVTSDLHDSQVYLFGNTPKWTGLVKLAGEPTATHEHTIEIENAFPDGWRCVCTCGFDTDLTSLNDAGGQAQGHADRTGHQIRR